MARESMQHKFALSTCAGMSLEVMYAQPLQIDIALRGSPQTTPRHPNRQAFGFVSQRLKPNLIGRFVGVAGSRILTPILGFTSRVAAAPKTRGRFGGFAGPVAGASGIPSKGSGRLASCPPNAICSGDRTNPGGEAGPYPARAGPNRITGLRASRGSVVQHFCNMTSRFYPSSCGEQVTKATSV